jgi:hypothetical protein
MFTTNLFEIKIQQEETQRRAAHQRLVKSLARPKGSSSKENKKFVRQSWIVQHQVYTLSHAMTR